MRIHVLAGVIAAIGLVGCGDGETPTPVPSNTPVPSATDPLPAEVDSPAPQSSEEDPEPTEPTESPSEPSSEPPPSEPSGPTPPPKPSATPTEPVPSALEQELSKLQPRELIERLSEEKQRDTATRALAARGSAAVEPLIEALGSDDWQVRAAAVFTLGQLGGEASPALPRLQELAESDDVPAVRDAAAFAIDSINTP